MKENENNSESNKENNKSVQVSQSSQNSDSDSEIESEIISKNSNSLKDNEIKPQKPRNYVILPDQENLEHYDLSFKIIVIGDSNVGKSSLAIKAIKNKFDPGYSATLGFEYFSFFIKIDEKIIKLQIWDTCGQEIYQSLITNFYRNSSLAIMVYAINNRTSFEHIDHWLKEIKRNSNPDAKIFLIGNKNDLEEERKISYEEGEKYSYDLDFSKFFESSAKSGFNAKNIFIEAAFLLYEDYNEYKLASSHNTSNYSESQEGKVLSNNPSNGAVKGRNTRNQKKRECC